MALRKIQSVDQVERALADARVYADAKGVPLTIERLAVCLGIGRCTLLNYDVADDATEEERAIWGALKNAREECQASMMEHGLGKGNSPIMPIFALKANYNYSDKPADDAQHVYVHFDGEDSIPD